jgi:hypothetical protein
MRRASVLCTIMLFITWGASALAFAQGDTQTVEVPNRISLTYSTQLAQDAVWQQVPASKNAETPTGPVPEYTEIDFQNYSDASSTWVNTGQYIQVYPVVTFPSDANAPYSQALTNLRAVLAARPTVPDGNLPMLPIVTAMQVIRSQVQYLDFASGSGIRYVTAAKLDVSPLTDDTLFYTFQGLTADGAYYIAAIFPVKSGVLPATPEPMNADQYNQFAAGYDTYLAGITAQLDALTPQSFSPDLTMIDSALASLTITSPKATIITPAGATTAEATFDNVHFTYDATLASRIEVDVIPPFVDTGGMSMFGSEPGRTEFTLYDYPATPAYRYGELNVIPVDSFPGTNTVSDQVLANLQAFLAARAPLAAYVNLTGAQSIPVLPVVNAGQVFVAEPEYLDFQNGTGVRFITFYSQDISPVSNDRLVYMFQGITSDGKYVIAAQFPVKAPVVPDSIDPNTFDYNALSADYPGYMTKTVTALDGVAAGDYTPSLDLLDALIQSVSVGQ